MLIVDLDVHQGDGTASILQGDPAVFTFSMHCDANFPFHKQASDLDVALPIGMEDDAYLRLLAPQLPELLARCGPTWCSTTPVSIRIRTICWANWRSRMRGSTGATAT